MVVLPQINGIHNSIEQKKDTRSEELCADSAGRKDDEDVPKTGEKEGKEVLGGRRSHPSLLKLELKKAYEFSPMPGLWSGRPNMTPLSCYPSKMATWQTPTTPTPR